MLFDDGERLTDVRESELTRVRYKSSAPAPPRLKAPLSVQEAKHGPDALQLGERLRVWWRFDAAYCGVVSELTTLIDAECASSPPHSLD